MTYRAPVADLLFAMRCVGGLDQGVAEGYYADLADGAAEQLLNEAAKFAEGVLAPLNHIGDRAGVKLADGHVTTAPGWKEAYAQWVANGWNAVSAAPEFGGMGLPHLLNAACTEMWNSANISFALCPLLGFGAVDAVESHASDALKAVYLEKMISGEWSATMNLTEPGAGSDLSEMRTRAERNPDGSYRIFGSKIFITYGEHDMTENIVHLVLARLPDAPPGTRGISLFLTPKFLVGADGALGARNDLRCVGVEHKLGIHASPTCTMAFGEQDGAIGFLIGQENKGLACMFAMMNSARLSVGLQGVAMGEASTQQALAFARERKQGRAQNSTSSGMDTIVHHPDVRRNLMTMRALTDAARAICYATAASLDRAKRLEDPQAKARNALLTPLAKAFSSDIANEVASIGVQVHGGMGFVEETGAAQFMRDARITGIYEGANGIQAIDLIMRKLPMGGGATIEAEIEDIRRVVEKLRGFEGPALMAMAEPLGEALESLRRATAYMLTALGDAPDNALAGATPYLRLFGYALGGALLSEIAMTAWAEGKDNPAHAQRIASARFFVENIAVGAQGLERAVIEGAASVNETDFLLAG